MMEGPLETEKEWAGELIFGGRRSLWLGRGLEKLFLDQPGGFGLPDGTGYGGSGGCFGFAFRGRAVHDHVPLLDGIVCAIVLRGGGGAGGGGAAHCGSVWCGCLCSLRCFRGFLQVEALYKFVDQALAALAVMRASPVRGSTEGVAEFGTRASFGGL